MNKNKAGFGLLELLLVIAVMASLLVLSIHRYEQYKQTVFVEAVQSDVALIFQGLSRYYHAQNCVNGVFPLLNQNLFSILLAQDYVSLNRLQKPSAVTEYQAWVVDSLQRSAQGKPIYQWVVKAVFASDTYLSSYRKQLDAQAMDLTQRSLSWRVLANPSAPTTTTPLWILNGGLSSFKQRQGITDDSCL